MFIYFTLFSVFIFCFLMSAVVGYLFHEVSNKLVTSRALLRIVGAIVAVVVSLFMTKLFLFEIWYVYVSVSNVALTIGLYVVLVKSSNK